MWNFRTLCPPRGLRFLPHAARNYIYANAVSEAAFAYVRTRSCVEVSCRRRRRRWEHGRGALMRVQARQCRAFRSCACVHIYIYNSAADGGRGGESLTALPTSPRTREQ